MYARFRSTLFMALRMRYRFPVRFFLAALAVTGVGIALHHLGEQVVGWRLGASGATGACGSVGWWWARHVLRSATTKAEIGRRAELDQRSGGTATLLDIAEHASARALRLQARVLRPSTTAGMSWWQRRFMDPNELGVLVGVLGLRLWGQRVWSSVEDATLRIGGPRMGKTLSHVRYGVTAPGGLITTSTRLDIATALHRVRLQRGAVHFFNPSDLGGVPSTVRWRVLAGCTDFATASRRASDLIPRSQGDRDLWDTQARRVLSILLHAAAVSGRSMRDVVRWSVGEGDTALQEVTDALLDGGGVGAMDRVSEIRAFWATNDRTRSSITTTMAIPLAWISDERARQLGDTPEDDPGMVDIADIILRGQTLHLLGREDHGTFAPLIAAFVAEIAHVARTLAARRPGGRLDPPLTMLFDEAPIVVPVPLDEWTADLGGSGVTLHLSAQSLAQIRARWGEHRANALLANIACFIVFGGSAVFDDLAKIASLTGSRRMRVIGEDHDRVDARSDGERRGEYQWVPVMSPAQIRPMHTGEVLILRRNLNPVIATTPRYRTWRRPLPLPTSLEEAHAQLAAAIAPAPRFTDRAADALTAAARRTVRAVETGRVQVRDRLGRATTAGLTDPEHARTPVSGDPGHDRRDIPDEDAAAGGGPGRE